MAVVLREELVALPERYLPEVIRVVEAGQRTSVMAQLRAPVTTAEVEAAHPVQLSVPTSEVAEVTLH